jgi:hypothetical protein
MQPVSRFGGAGGKVIDRAPWRSQRFALNWPRRAQPTIPRHKYRSVWLKPKRKNFDEHTEIEEEFRVETPPEAEGPREQEGPQGGSKGNIRHGAGGAHIYQADLNSLQVASGPGGGLASMRVDGSKFTEGTIRLPGTRTTQAW